MKKSFKVLLVFLLSFAIVGKVYAKTFNYSCMYTLTDGKGDKITFGLRFKDMEEDYYKNSKYNGNDSSFWKQHVSYLYYKNGTVTEKTFNFWSGGTISGFDYADKKYVKEIVLPSQTSAYNFMRNSVNLTNNSIQCPTMFWYQSNGSNIASVTSSTSRIEECPYSITSENYKKYNCYDEFGTSYMKVQNTQLSGPTSYCFDSATSTSGKKCTTITDNLYDTENQVECEYTSNIEGKRFRLIYDKSKQTLRFDDEGYGWTLDSSVEQKTEGSYRYLTNSSLLSQFASAAAKNNTCPTQINCYCDNNILTGAGKTCYFNNASYESNKCGKVTSLNGEQSGEAGKLPGTENGTEPSAPGGFEIGGKAMTCEELMGKNLTKIFKFFISSVRIIGAIVAIVVGMLNFLPAVTSKDAGALKAAAKKSVWMLVILAVILLLPVLARTIGKLFEFDISCLV